MKVEQVWDLIKTELAEGRPRPVHVFTTPEGRKELEEDIRTYPPTHAIYIMGGAQVARGGVVIPKDLYLYGVCVKQVTRDFWLKHLKEFKL